MGRKEEILNRVEEEIDNPMVTPKFGDRWKEFAVSLDKPALINIAWYNGKKAILLEREIEILLNEIKSYQNLIQ